MNTVTGHGACTVLFGVVGMGVCLVCTLPRTLRKVSWFAVGSFGSIVAAVVITMVAIGVERPQGRGVELVGKASLHKGFEAVTNIIFAYAGEYLTFPSHSSLLPLLSLFLFSS